jgi:phosphatidylinositol-3-phosphatase
VMRVVIAAALTVATASACASHQHAAGNSTAAIIGSPASNSSSVPATSSSPSTQGSSTVGGSATTGAVPGAAGSSKAAPAPATTAPSGYSAQRPCGWEPANAHYAHVVWIWMENKPFGSVIGSSSAPYENALAAQCGLATNYRGITHPSLPNYLAATGGSVFGVSDDAGPAAHPISAPSIFSQIDQAGLSWRAYEESMPANCDTSATSPYAVKHNPPAYFVGLRASCMQHDIPLAGNLQHDIAAGTLPSFSFITPNLCNDMHDCSVHTGDTWLATWIPRLLSGPNYQAGNTLIVLTWDEGVGSVNRIPTIVVAPSVRPGLQVGTGLDHYALLRSSEDLLGLAHLEAAASASSMAAAFGL